MKWYQPVLVIGAAITCFTLLNNSNVKPHPKAVYNWTGYNYSLYYNLKKADSIGFKHLRIKALEIEWTNKGVFYNNTNGYAGLKENEFIGLNWQMSNTVFIENELFYNIDSTDIAPMAQAIVNRLIKYNIELFSNVEYSYYENMYYSFENKNNATENKAFSFWDKVTAIEIDCDWTEKTKNKYFYLLTELKKQSKKNIESTLRLHQYKNRSTMGIPPVSTVNLMCYNTGDLSKLKTENSIFDMKVIKDYIKNNPKYPLKLNIAVPCFSWLVVFKNNTFHGLQTCDPSDWSLNYYTTKTSNNLYTVKDDFNIENLALKPGDKLRLETTSKADIQELLQYIEDQNIEFGEIIYFDLQNLVNRKDLHETL